MSKLNDKAADLADLIRYLDTLKQQEANVREAITKAYAELGAMLADLPEITEPTTQQVRKELQHENQSSSHFVFGANRFRGLEAV